MLSRSVTKLYEFIALLFSINMMIFLIFAFINNSINNFEMKKKLVYGLFKNFEINANLMMQFKLIQQRFNEVECKNNADFFDRK